MYISNCCGASVTCIASDNETAICTECHEWCSIEKEEDSEMNTLF